MKISFDFDGVLSDPKMVVLAKKFVDSGIEVWIVTRRCEYYNNTHLYFIAGRIGVPRERIIFTCVDYKAPFVTGFDLHIDDDSADVDIINSPMSDCVALKYSKNDE